MEWKENVLSDLKKKITDYVEARVKLTELHIYEKLSELFSSFIAIAILALLLILTYLFAAVTLGFYFSERLNSLIQGFGIIALFNFLLVIVFLLLRSRIVKPGIRNTIIHILTEKEKNENENEERY